jgi:hypothetical protein
MTKTEKKPTASRNGRNRSMRDILTIEEMAEMSEIQYEIAVKKKRLDELLAKVNQG